MSLIKRKCDVCGKEYMADTRNLKRGWGLCCSKSCAAKKRERNKRTSNISYIDIEDQFDDDDFEVDEWIDNDQWENME